MDSGALAHTLKPLERDRLVAIDIDPDDRRNRLITLTPLGRARLAASDALWENAQRAFEQAFGRVKSDTLRDALSLLVSDKFATTFEETMVMADEGSSRSSWASLDSESLILLVCQLLGIAQASIRPRLKGRRHSAMEVITRCARLGIVSESPSDDENKSCEGVRIRMNG
jgi:hypothetical protein